MRFLYVQFCSVSGNRTLIDLFGSGRTVKHCFGRSLPCMFRGACIRITFFLVKFEKLWGRVPCFSCDLLFGTCKAAATATSE